MNLALRRPITISATSRVRRSSLPNHAPPQASGIAFAESGNLYVGLLGRNQIAVLSPTGTEIGRLSSPKFDSPGDSLSAVAGCS
jgi:hypothetical protein